MNIFVGSEKPYQIGLFYYYYLFLKCKLVLFIKYNQQNGPSIPLFHARLHFLPFLGYPITWAFMSFRKAVDH